MLSLRVDQLLAQIDSSPNLRRWLQRGVLVLLLGGYLLIGLRIRTYKERADQSESVAQALSEAVRETSGAVVIADSSGRITKASPSATELFGTELLGQHVHDFCPPAAREYADAQFQKAVASVAESGDPEVWQVDCDIRRANAKPLPAQLTIRVIPEAQGVMLVASVTPRARIRSMPRIEAAPEPTTVASPK